MSNFNFNEDSFLKRYDDIEIICKFNINDVKTINNVKKKVQKGGSFDDFKTAINTDKFFDEIEPIEKITFLYLRRAFNKKYKKFSSKNVENYVLNKYDINSKDYSIHIVKDNIIRKWLSENIKEKSNYKKNKIYVDIGTKVSFYNFNNDLKKYINIIKKFNINIKSNGDLIIYGHQPFEDKNYFKFVKNLCSNYSSAIIYFPKYFLKKDTLGFIILQNKLKKKYNIKNYTNKIIDFVKERNEHNLKEFKTFNELLKIFFDDEDKFKIIFNKLNTNSFLKFNAFNILNQK